MYKQDLALYNVQLLMCHKTKPNQIKQTGAYLVVIVPTLEIYKDFLVRAKFYNTFKKRMYFKF